ncbi:hypothetical protein [Mycolicibacterium baixiangningiae]|uniref:hypothetical protein n=1 Tax=Mycolicibacterium baixiangningiae TaxID=2761578 RepID=UPI0018D18D5E|nr:hypothetical protein [Mycolicibacterium baixiangningiae]
MDPAHEHGRLVDWDRTACLCNAGAPGLVAAVAVGPDGGETLWLVDQDQLNHPDVDHGNPSPPHERTGPLPAAIRDLITPPPQCGRPTLTTGRPCRTRVLNYGDSCLQHRDTRHPNPAPSSPLSHQQDWQPGG